MSANHEPRVMVLRSEPMNTLGMILLVILGSLIGAWAMFDVLHYREHRTKPKQCQRSPSQRPNGPKPNGPRPYDQDVDE